MRIILSYLCIATFTHLITGCSKSEPAAQVIEPAQIQTKSATLELEAIDLNSPAKEDAAKGDRLKKAERTVGDLPKIPQPFDLNTLSEAERKAPVFDAGSWPEAYQEKNLKRLVAPIAKKAKLTNAKWDCSSFPCIVRYRSSKLDTCNDFMTNFFQDKKVRAMKNARLKFDHWPLKWKKGQSAVEGAQTCSYTLFPRDLDEKQKALVYHQARKRVSEWRTRPPI